MQIQLIHQVNFLLKIFSRQCHQHAILLNVAFQQMGLLDARICTCGSMIHLLVEITHSLISNAPSRFNALTRSLLKL
jgi:hypothetical protein